LLCFAASPTTVLWGLSMPTSTANLYPKIFPTNEEKISLLEMSKMGKDLFNDVKVESFISKSTKFFPAYEMTSVPIKIYKSSENLGLNERVTVLGDAAHKTTTQAGLGATAAMHDAKDLAQVILSLNEENCLSSLRMYEKRMGLRAQKVINASYGNTIRIHKILSPPVQVFSNWVMWFVGRIIKFVQFIKRV
jgi:flavin-dependent dehydrogenase